ncbi:nitrile hydratase subunit alpha [Jannaschia sp. Os4]|uniref:nitrile hydratase subunit alpha n=1 Tax=Jannaschia sp. Os4 TaxID=2807617 RepID=UPI001939ADDD|nr:nitrile hydratase subunit alpha [Jannaschia sp. Os4]MBM2577683.1 nitrile hydratase subunit alpha [Jannaschia sp. Os4]
MPHDHHHHEGTSPSGHPYRADQDGPLTYWQAMEVAVRELLVEKGVVTADQVQRQIEAMDARSPADGAAFVARTWTDPDFAALARRDATAACREMGFDPGTMRLIAVENDEGTHNVVVCTLCSCYPRNLLGLPPDWYKSREYRSRTVREPRAVLREFGLDLPEGTTVRVHDSTADMRYVVIPRRPDGTDGWEADLLAALVTRDSMIGTGVARVPS